MSALAATLPRNTGSGYVAAAYIVFFSIVLIYVAIMAIRLSRVERDVRELRALGASHKTAPVALRERLAFTEAQACELAQSALATTEVREAVVICTCNRTEVYLVVGDSVRAEGAGLGLLAQRAEIRPTELAEAIYSPRNCDARSEERRVGK